MTIGEHDMGDLGLLASLMAAGSGGVSISSVIEQSGAFVKRLDMACPVKTAAIFGGLLLNKRFQPNCLRLEVLIHICVCAANGVRPAPPQILMQGYHLIGQACGLMEDPPEDVFVGGVYSKRGNYRVLEGIWEGGTFYLQRFINLVDTLPGDRGFPIITNTVHALLKVSDLICARAGLHRNDLGSGVGENELLSKIAAKGRELRELVSISADNLREIGVDLDDLAPFIFDPSKRRQLSSQVICNTDLEARPLVMMEDTLYLVLPTAVSVAVRRFVIKCLGTGGGRESFIRNLSMEYSRLFYESPMLGEDSALVQFSCNERVPYGCLSREIDTGRYLNIVYILDPIDDFGDQGFGGMFLGDDDLFQNIAQAIGSMEESASQRPGFKDGITLLVSCGVGRGIAMQELHEPGRNWRHAFISSPDFCALSEVSEIKVLDLWRMLRMEDRLKGSNVFLQNMNGLLNLYAWADSLNGHMVPHADMPEDMSDSGVVLLAIEQNGLLNIRHNVLLSTDRHVQKFIDGAWIEVKKEGASFFSEDEMAPLYGQFSMDRLGPPLGAFISSYRCWWFELKSPSDEVRTDSYDRWKMVGIWLVRAAPVLERAFSSMLANGAILWRCTFEQPQQVTGADILGSEQDAVDAIAVTVDGARRIVDLRINPQFDKAIFNPRNIAERALVRAFVKGVATLAGTKEESVDTLVNEIMPNLEARHSHAFHIRKFRDHISGLPKSRLISISRFDDALDKLGMGWAVRDRQAGGVIEGKVECLKYLNSLVSFFERDLCEELRQYNRQVLLEKLIMNHEVAGFSRDHWHRTAAAVLALRSDKAAALLAMRNYEFKLNSIFQPTRNLLEMAVCEAVVEGGLMPGELDISGLLAKASRLYHVGGWSDLIRWDMMRPLVLVRPLGDVHVEHDFMDTVLDGFGSATSKYRFMASARGYAKNLEPPAIVASTEEAVDPKFIEAWIDELGADIDTYRRFIDAIEDYAVRKDSAVIAVRRSELIGLSDSPEIGSILVANLTLKPRDSWQALPEGYDRKDIDPWRFRRRLSALRCPLLQVNLEEDPVIILAPGLVREGFSSMFSNYYSASYPDRHLGQSMRRYAGHARNRDGMAFNTKVADRLIELGWQAKPELKLTKILKKALDRDYGDVDVLAWSPDAGRVLIIECKDLQFKKTYGEIAEQLSDFLGEEMDGKRDLLRKHLDRVEVLSNHAAKLFDFLELGGTPSIESVVVFRHPVPMQFSMGAIRDHADLYTFDELEALIGAADGFSSTAPT